LLVLHIHASEQCNGLSLKLFFTSTSAPFCNSA
jgi:hypothetical protein